MKAVVEKTKSSSAQEYVDNLLNEGDKVGCDNTSEDFRNHNTLPPFYDEELFKRGQSFFYKHIFAFFFSKCLGLIAVLSIPSIRKILIFTKMSGSEMTAYRRYVATIFHMMIWYDSDFKPGSKMWKSISEVKALHNSASNRSCSAGMKRITQKEMALTQFGFMGISICRSKMLGIHDASEEDWRAFVHLWKVIGCLMGIDERFNLCNGTLDETRERCNILMEQVFRPNIEQKNEEFLNMSRYMLQGLWSLNLFIKFETVMYFLHALTQDQNNNKEYKSTCYKLKSPQNLKLLVTITYILSWNWFRIFQNYTFLLSLWLVRVFPFLAVYQFGRKNAWVRIMVDHKKD